MERMTHTNRKDGVMNNTVKIKIKTVYGKELAYPKNYTAVLLTTLTGRKTFTPGDLRIIKRLGYNIEQFPKYIPIEYNK